LIGLADRYCAFVSARNYRRSLLPPVALGKLASNKEMPVDPDVVAHFAYQVGPYPPGTLVKLENGEVGVVSRGADANGALRIHVLRGADGGLLPLAEQRLTCEEGCEVAAALHEDEARVRFTMKHIWGELAAL
jgi:hypothetical protein